MVIVERNQAGCLVQAVWFLLIGWWFTGLWISVAWLLCVLILPLPLGLAMLHSVPLVLARRRPDGGVRVRVMSASGEMVDIGHEQLPWIVRALYFVFIGCWWSAIVILLAYAFALTFFGLPIAIWLFDRVPGAITLKR